MKSSLKNSAYFKLTEGVWKHECRPTRNGWFEAVSKTCFSVCTQSMSSSSHTNSFLITFIAYNRCVGFNRTKSTWNYLKQSLKWNHYLGIWTPSNHPNQIKIIKFEAGFSCLVNSISIISRVTFNLSFFNWRMINSHKRILNWQMMTSFRSETSLELVPATCISSINCLKFYFKFFDLSNKYRTFVSPSQGLPGWAGRPPNAWR